MNPILQRLEDNLHANAAEGRHATKTAGFTVYVSNDSEHYLMSFAAPHAPGPDDWHGAIAELTEAFERHRRRPRLEFLRELHPDLPDALESAGFVRDASTPVMTLERNAFEHGSDELPFPYVRLEPGDRGGLEEFLRRQARAYGSAPGDGLAWLPSLERGLRTGATIGAALEDDGEPVAGAIVMTSGGTGELAGVWTDPDRQRRGYALALCRRLLGEYFDAGNELCWLSAAEGAQRLYERLGFERVGTQVNYGMPHPGAV